MSPTLLLECCRQFVYAITFAFATSDGVRHIEIVPLAFTTETKCEIVARRIMLAHYERLDGLYWWCGPIPLDKA